MNEAPLPLVLLCKCGVLASLSGEAATAAGWRVDTKDRDICPACVAKRRAKRIEAIRDKFGTKAIPQRIADFDSRLGRR